MNSFLFATYHTLPTSWTSRTYADCCLGPTRSQDATGEPERGDAPAHVDRERPRLLDETLLRHGFETMGHDAAPSITGEVFAVSVRSRFRLASSCA
jgi:hypothetical protein